MTTMENNEIRIGLIGSQSMHAWSFARVCNEPTQSGNYRFPNARVTAVFGVDDTPEHIRTTMEKGSVPHAVPSLEELFRYCNAFMILQRRGGEHVDFAEEIIKRGYPVFVDKPVCCTEEDIQRLKQLSLAHDVPICGGSGFKYNRQIVKLKDRIVSGDFGEITDASITYSADIDSPFGGIFFYLPHAVEIMLELFGYDWHSVRAEVRAHDDFAVYVTYEKYRVCLNLNNSKICRVEINGAQQICEEINADDIFEGNMRNFVSAVEGHRVTKNATELTEHVRVILAVQRAMEDNTEISRTQA